MDSFSGSDSLRALCAPLCCCFSRRLALSPSNGSLNQLGRDADADADAARARSGELGFDTAAHSDDLAAYEARLGGPAWGMQAGVLHLGAHSTTTTPRSRQRRRGGDISGGGTDTGSGLTRWTLFRSWLRGGQGAIQLPDSEDEAENGNSRSSSSTRLLGRTYGDEDAAPIALDDVSLPPAPPFAATLSSQYSSGPPSSSDQTTSEGRSILDAEAASEREARRQRRRIRRQARELGLSPEEYTERVNNGLLSVTAAESATEATREAQDDVAQTRSHASTESSGSRRSRRAAASATDPPVSADGAYPETTTSSSSSSRRRRRHDDGHRSQLSVSSHSNTVSSSSSSKRSDRHRRRARGAGDTNTAPARSPLESLDDRFFEDEDGQLHAVEQGDETTVSYEHIGVLPGFHTSVADDA